MDLVAQWMLGYATSLKVIKHSLKVDLKDYRLRFGVGKGGFCSRHGAIGVGIDANKGRGEQWTACGSADIEGWIFWVFVRGTGGWWTWRGGWCEGAMKFTF